MKKFLLLICFFVALTLSESIFANTFKLDATLGYTRNISSNDNGYLFSPGVYFLLLDNTILDFSLGVEAQHYSYKSTAWTSSYSFVPCARLQIPFFMFKTGFGYDWNDDSNSSPLAFLGVSFFTIFCPF